jgi:hypothetical protein
MAQAGFAFGYFGGLMDTATGLIYVGNGQYYDPSTGRFLTRNANPNSPNPYVPFDPTGLLLGPLGLLAVFYAGRRSKKSAPYVVFLIVLVALPMSVSLACGSGGSAPAEPTPTQPPATETSTSGGSDGGDALSDPGAASNTPKPPCDDDALTPTPTPTPTPTADQELRDIYGVILINGNMTWSSAQIDVVRTAIRDIASRFGSASTFRVKFNVSDSSPIRMVRGTSTSYIPEIIAGECTTINAGGCTSPNKTINFASLLPDGGRPETARNNVVHEMGHVFSNEHGGSPETDLGAHPADFANRRDEILQDNTTVQWQLNPTRSAKETFGDFFVAWTKNEWQPLTNADGTISIAGIAKAWMDTRMQDW